MSTITRQLLYHFSSKQFSDTIINKNTNKDGLFLCRYQIETVEIRKEEMAVFIDEWPSEPSSILRYFETDGLSVRNKQISSFFHISLNISILQVISEFYAPFQKQKGGKRPIF